MRNESENKSKSYDVSVIASNLLSLHEHVTRTLERTRSPARGAMSGSS